MLFIVLLILIVFILLFFILLFFMCSLVLAKKEDYFVEKSMYNEE